MLVALLSVALLFGFVLTRTPMILPTIGIMILVIIILSSFLSLTVSVDKTHVRIKFGYGLFKKSFPLDGMEKVRKVRNHWYYGWGIKGWWGPYMWIYSVSGLDAVEIITSVGNRFRIGTDEPKKLEIAISKALKKR